MSAAPSRARRREPGSGDGRSLKEAAYAEIKRLILGFELKPGELLNEQSISERIGIGRTPVHQALQLLHSQDLVKIIPRKGIIITPGTLSDALLVLEAREVIEVGMARLAAERATPALVVAMERTISQGRGAAERGDFEGFMHSDRDFHAALAEAAGNGILLETLQALHDRIARIWLLRGWRSEDLAQTQQEHVAIFRAIARRDPGEAATAMRAHLDSLRRRALEGRV